MSRSRKWPSGLLGVGMAGFLLILMPGAVPSFAEELNIDGIRFITGDPLDTLDYDDDSADIHDEIQDGGFESPSLPDDAILIVLPGFKHEYYLIVVEIHNGLPRLRFEEVGAGKRRVED